MGELTDYEINKLLAGIAGVAVVGDGTWLVPFCSECEGQRLPCGKTCGTCRGDGVDPCNALDVPRDPWSPLTDRSQLGWLQERFDVATKRRKGGTRSHDGHWSAECDGEIAVDPDLKRAVCLAIVKAHQPDAGQEGA